ncbi:maltose acetyltransferase domain-containing protein [Algibacter mikhailovii]|uniref:maltose acetyltransferase domain-containing protein n=1 Tax=Algibacter mikhailovii TaxID=425498 RepID=UPI0031E8ABC6
MTEKEKMIAGKLYNPSDEELSQDRHESRLLQNKFNSLGEINKMERENVMKTLIKNAGENLYIAPLFIVTTAII